MATGTTDMVMPGISTPTLASSSHPSTELDVVFWLCWACLAELGLWIAAAFATHK
jgi:hypothetical protein